MLYKGAPPFSMSALYIIMNFNPRAPYGARPNIRGVWMWWHSFNPRAPCGARRSRSSLLTERQGFNPRAPCGARRTIDHIRHSLTLVSIHAPRMGRDLWGVANPRQHDRFNPRAPCGARLRDDLAGPEAFMFQSTRPMRGATTNMLRKNNGIEFQSTRPMRGATCYYKQTHYAIRTFQSTRPMRGATFALYNVAPVVFVFQSTRPMRGATGDLRIPRQCRRVSIHAPHAGRDCTPYGVPGESRSFNPRAPCGARRRTCC